MGYLIGLVFFISAVYIGRFLEIALDVDDWDLSFEMVETYHPEKG